MSVRLMGEVWGLDVDHARLLVLLALADHADDRGRNIYPSLGLVAWKTGYSKRRIRAIVSELREHGVLVQVRRSHWHRAAVYHLDVSKLPRKIPFESKKYREEKISSQESEGGKSAASREEIPSSREENLGTREEAATSAKSSSESSIESSGNPGARLLKKDKESDSKNEDSKKLSTFRLMMYKSQLYSVDELIDLKDKSCEQLEVIHAEKMSGHPHGNAGLQALPISVLTEKTGVRRVRSDSESCLKSEMRRNFS